MLTNNGLVRGPVFRADGLVVAKENFRAPATDTGNITRIRAGSEGLFVGHVPRAKDATGNLFDDLAYVTFEQGSGDTVDVTAPLDKIRPI